ncbi:hypothetical protein V8C37DRAFT_393961 [Trichoderma ceciliae]
MSSRLLLVLMYPISVSVCLRLMITGFPDPFAVATINGEQTKTTTVSKKTLNPYWNESFDLYDPPSTVKTLLIC